jgi:O-antigen ligase
LIGWSILRLRRLPDRLDVAVIVALGLYLIVATMSRDRTGSLETLALVAVYALTFWAARSAVSLPAVRDVLAVGVATALAFTLAVNAFLLIREKVAYIQATGLIPPQEGFDVFPWETANAMPILVLLAFGFLPLVPPRRYRRILTVVTAVASLVVLAFSAGRAGVLGLSVALLIVGLMSERWRSWFANRAARVRWGLGGGAMLVVAVGVWRTLGPFIHAMGVTGRLDLYPATLAMFIDRPIFGSGPSTWPWARYMYGTEAARTLGVRLTHDVPLQTLADGGVVLGVAMLTIAVAWLMRSFSRQLPPQRRAAFAVLVGYAAAVLFDDFSFLPSVTVLLIVLAAVALPVESTASATASRLRFMPLATAAICLAIAAPFVVRVDVARLRAADARAAAVVGDWARASNEFAAATDLHPESGGYWLGLAKARAELGDRDGARAAYAAARVASPGDARAYGGLAALSSNVDERIALLKQAADRTSGDPQYAYRLGIELAGKGNLSGAAEAWGRAADLRSAAFGDFEFDRYGIDVVAVMRGAIAHTFAAPRPDVNIDPAARWDAQLALDKLPDNAGLSWRAVDAARHGQTDLAAELAEKARVARAVHAYEALAATAAFDCRRDEQRHALSTAVAIGSVNLSTAVAGSISIRREYLYREPTIGPMQPPGTMEAPIPLTWPWSVINEKPNCQ